MSEGGNVEANAIEKHGEPRYVEPPTPCLCTTANGLAQCVMDAPPAPALSPEDALARIGEMRSTLDALGELFGVQPGQPLVDAARERIEALERDRDAARDRESDLRIGVYRARFPNAYYRVPRMTDEELVAAVAEMPARVERFTRALASLGVTVDVHPACGFETWSPAPEGRASKGVEESALVRAAQIDSLARDYADAKALAEGALDAQAEAEKATWAAERERDALRAKAPGEPPIVDHAREKALAWELAQGSPADVRERIADAAREHGGACASTGEAHTSGAWVRFRRMLAIFTERLEAALSERDEARAAYETERDTCSVERACAERAEAEVERARGMLAARGIRVATLEEVADRWVRERDEARAEVARLRAERVVVADTDTLVRTAAEQVETIARLTRERDEARAEVERLRGTGTLAGFERLAAAIRPLVEAANAASGGDGERSAEEAVSHSVQWALAEIRRIRAELYDARGVISGARYCLEEDIPSAARACLEGNGVEPGIAEEYQNDLDRMAAEAAKLRDELSVAQSQLGICRAHLDHDAAKLQELRGLLGLREGESLAEALRELVVERDARNEGRGQLSAMAAERDRWAARVRVLEARLVFIHQIAEGHAPRVVGMDAARPAEAADGR